MLSFVVDAAKQLELLSDFPSSPPDALSFSTPTSGGEKSAVTAQAQFSVASRPGITAPSPPIAQEAGKEGRVEQVATESKATTERERPLSSVSADTGYHDTDSTGRSRKTLKYSRPSCYSQ